MSSSFPSQNHLISSQGVHQTLPAHSLKFSQSSEGHPRDRSHLPRSGSLGTQTCRATEIIGVWLWEWLTLRNWTLQSHWAPRNPYSSWCSLNSGQWAPTGPSGPQRSDTSRLPSWPQNANRGSPCAPLFCCIPPFSPASSVHTHPTGQLNPRQARALLRSSLLIQTPCTGSFWLLMTQIWGLFIPTGLWSEKNTCHRRWDGHRAEQALTHACWPPPTWRCNI